jgi:hypothetical protein
MIGGNYAMTTILPGKAYLRIIRYGAVYTGYVSENGTNWTLVGAHTVISGRERSNRYSDEHDTA